MPVAEADPAEFFALFGTRNRPNPYPAYRRWREHAPLAVLPWGVLVASGHAEAAKVLRDPGFGHPEPKPAKGVVPSFLELNPPDHTRLRGLVSKAFTPRMIGKLEPVVETITTDLLTTALADGEADLMAALAAPLPVEVIGEMLGVPRVDRPLLAAWSHATARQHDPAFLHTPETAGEAERARLAFVDYFGDLADQRRRDRGDDLLSSLLTVSEADDVLSEAELLATLTLLLIAGCETATNLIGNGALALLRHPRGLALLGRNGEFVEQVVEECLRYDPPIQLTERTALRDTSIGDVEVPRGATVIVLLAAANRDPVVFAEPDAFDPAREAGRHLAFSNGIHFCLGSHLARLEGRVVIRELLRRAPSMAVAGPLVWNPTATMRGLHRFPVVLRP
ncbi:cytochrome P450 [Amycolatopsis sp. NPDC005003]